MYVTEKQGCIELEAKHNEVPPSKCRHLMYNKGLKTNALTCGEICSACHHGQRKVSRNH